MLCPFSVSTLKKYFEYRLTHPCFVLLLVMKKCAILVTVLCQPEQHTVLDTFFLNNAYFRNWFIVLLELKARWEWQQSSFDLRWRPVPCFCTNGSTQKDVVFHRLIGSSTAGDFSWTLSYGLDDRVETQGTFWGSGCYWNSVNECDGMGASNASGRSFFSESMFLWWSKKTLNVVCLFRSQIDLMLGISWPDSQLT